MIDLILCKTRSIHTHSLSSSTLMYSSLTQNAFIASFKNKHLLIAGPQPHQHSLINLFSYED